MRLNRRARPAVGGFIPPAACCLPPTFRAGISLLEVLISIGIVAVGLVSVAALIPVGGIQAQRAGIEQRKAELGLNVFREFKTRGMGLVDPTANCPWGRYIPAPPAPAPGWYQYFSNPPVPAPALPVAIDPLMISAGGNDAAANTLLKDFPANFGAAPRMDRLTLKSASTVAGNAFTPNLPLADTIFRADDDVQVDPGADRQMPAISMYSKNTAGNYLKRDSAGLYSWLATLTPDHTDQVTPTAGTPCTLSVAVFYQRLMPNPSFWDPTLVHEGTATVAPPTGTVATADYNSVGGGEVQLTAPVTPAGPYGPTNPNPLSYVRPGTWLMLARAASGPPANRPAVFEWYRVVACDTIDESAPAPAAPGQHATLAGPDWNFAQTDNPQTYAFLFDGIVAVYQRTILLEGPSKWSQ